MARSTKLVTATPIPIKLGQNRVNPSACWSEIAQTISSKPATIKRSHAILPSGTSSGLSGYAAIDRNGGARYEAPALAGQMPHGCGNVVGLRIMIDRHQRQLGGDARSIGRLHLRLGRPRIDAIDRNPTRTTIGRASCRERGCQYV